MSHQPPPRQGALRAHEFTRIAVEWPSDGLALATLDRPERLNAVDHALHRELADLFRLVEIDPEVRALVITGRGSGFSVGGDLEMMEETAASSERVLDMLADGRRVITSLLDCRKPIVSAVNGMAMGLGCQVALLSDVTIAAERANFSDGHIRAGVAAGDGGALIWPLLVGMARAKRYLMTGDTLSAQEAVEIGLILEAVADEDLHARALEWGRRLADGPTEAIAFTKLVLNQWLRLGQLISLDFGLAGESLNLLTADARDRISALKEG